VEKNSLESNHRRKKASFSIKIKLNSFKVSYYHIKLVSKEGKKSRKPKRIINQSYSRSSKAAVAARGHKNLEAISSLRPRRQMTA
jgi:hypothetical protein